MGEIETAFPPGKLDSIEREPPGWVVVLALVAGVAIVGGTTLGGYWSLSSHTAPRIEPPISVPLRPPPEGISDGSDPNQASLPPGDSGFVDTRGGWGWGDKCWIHIKAGKWGWAKAECDEGMILRPASPQARASLLYNEALIARQAGDTEGARSALLESLSLREHPEVRATLNGLPAAN